MLRHLLAIHQNEPRVYRVLRDCNDSPVIECDSGNILVRRRHEQEKPVILLATKYYCYLFKRKHYKLYARWPLHRIDVHVSGPNLVVILDRGLAALNYELDPPKEEEEDPESSHFYDPSRIELLSLSKVEVVGLHEKLSSLIQEAKERTSVEVQVPEITEREGQSSAAQHDGDDNSSVSSDDEDAGATLARGGSSSTAAGGGGISTCCPPDCGEFLSRRSPAIHYH